MSVSFDTIKGWISMLNVELFLIEFRKAIRLQKATVIGGRKKNRDLASKLGWTYEDILNFLFEELEPAHCISGPEGERDPQFDPGIIFKFKVKIENIDVYVKIKKILEEDFFVVISFHEAER
jgi:hypothetical protein